MAELVCLHVNWDRTALPVRLPDFHELHIGPEPGFPAGRKGLALAGAWRQLSGSTTDGLLLLDGDVAADVLDLAAMRAAIHSQPGVVHTAPVRLWPKSTNRDGWIWGHWGDGPSQVSDPRPWRFSFCFTYVPRAVIEQAVADGLDGWAFPWVDREMSCAARAAGVPVHVVPGCTPKHLHF